MPQVCYILGTLLYISSIFKIYDFSCELFEFDVLGEAENDDVEFGKQLHTYLTNKIILNNVKQY